MSSTPVNVNYLKKCKTNKKKITMLTCYDYSFAKLLDKCGVDILLVGDSLGMVMQGKDSTVPVTLEDMKYHTRCVAAGTRNALVLADMSFGTYETSKEDAFQAAAELMRSGANMVKLEGGKEMAETVEFLQGRGIPVCGHIGLTPQSVNTLGGYKVQGKDEASSQKLINDAKALELANASMIVLECIPSKLAKEITEIVSCPTIGIGAGVDCDGQVLVLQDMLGLTEGKTAKFVKNFMKTSSNIEEAIISYVKEVTEETYPSLEYSY